MERDDQEMNFENSELPANSEPTYTDSFMRSYFSKSVKGPLTAEEKEAYFYTWYNNGRPSGAKLHNLLLEKFPGKFVPTALTLDTWLPDYKHRAMALDEAATEQVEAVVIAEKVAMLKRHAETGLKMQNVAIEYIDANRGDMSMPAAVRLLVEGIRIERESRGIPEALEKMSKMTDEQLLDEVKKLMTSSSVRLEELDESP